MAIGLIVVGGIVVSVIMANAIKALGEIEQDNLRALERRPTEPVS